MSYRVQKWLPALAFALFFAPLHVQAAVSTGPIVTNDTFLPKQWYLDSIHAREGWNAATGSRAVIVAVIDSGMDISHEDLKEAIWNNPGEIPDNGKDDEEDGFPDNVHGWNFVTNSPDVNPMQSPRGSEEAYIHGTAIASLIAGIGNNDRGISGVAWNARIMPLVVLDVDGYGRDEQLIEAIKFAVSHGASIINISLVGYEYDPRLSEAVRAATAAGVLVVSAAGNSDKVGGVNLDQTPGYPACDKGIPDLGQLTVTSLDRANRKVSRANYGACVDLSAPGSDMFAARPTRTMKEGEATAGYIDKLSGTSISAPLVSGLAALLKSKHPEWRGPQIARRILETADPVDEANPLYRGMLGRGRMNVRRALEEDAHTEEIGPLQLEGSAAGQSPMVRVLTSSGRVLRSFSVGASGDRRAIRATFIRWQKNVEPDIAVTTVGDTTGGWRIYRPDGLLIAAGTVGSKVAGGVYIAAADLESNGQDVLFLGEADGRRAWLVSRGFSEPLEFIPFASTSSRGIVPLSVTRPVPSFVLTAVSGPSILSVIGQAGNVLSGGRLPAKQDANVRTVRRGSRVASGDIFRVETKALSVLLETTPNGLTRTDVPLAADVWSQVPQGEPRGKNWLYYETWPR